MPEELKQGLENAVKEGAGAAAAGGNGNDGGAGTPPAGAQPQAGQYPNNPAAAAGQTPGQAPSAEEVLDWLKDERIGKMWSKEGKPDPNLMYKSYRELEKVFTPLKQQNEAVRKLFDELQVQPEQMTEIVKVFKDFQDPENPLTKRANYFGAWLENPMYQQKVINFFQEMEKAELQRLYPGMTEDAIRKIQSMEGELQTLKQREQERDFEKDTQTNLTAINTALAEAKKYSDSRGFQFTDEIEQKLLEYGEKNRISGQYLFQEFLKMYQEELDKAHSVKLEQDILKRLNKTKESQVPTGAAPPAQPSGGPSLREALKIFVNSAKV